MKHYFLLLLIFSLTGLFEVAAQDQDDWVAPAEADALENPFAHDDEAALEKGREIYGMLCELCHGDRGDGTGAAGQAWDPPPADFTSEEVQSQSDGALYWKVSEGNPPAMLTYKNMLSEEEWWQVVTWLRQFRQEQ